MEISLSSKKPISFKNVFATLLRDPSSLSLLGANAVTMYFAIREGWSVNQLIVVYWIQSIIIGLFNVYKMLSLRNFSTEGVSAGDGPMEANRKTQVTLAVFFAVHYGFFHLIYLVFIGGFFFSTADPIQWKYVAATSAFFFANHLFSALFNKQQEEKPNIGTYFIFPYARILPMHLIIIFGGFFGGASLIFFLLLKTLADLIMHGIEHTPLQKKA